MGWETFNQGEWAAQLGGTNTAGICRALVLVWLRGDGTKPPENNSTNSTAIAEFMASTNLATSGAESGLRWRGTNKDADGQPQPTRHELAGDAGEKALEQLLAQIFVGQGKYLIGMGSPDGPGHAVGFINSGHSYSFFEPNKGNGHWPLSEFSNAYMSVVAHLVPLQVKYGTSAESKLMIWQFAPQ